MITSFRSRGLRLLYERSDGRRISAIQVNKIERILARLDQAENPNQMNLPGYRLHPLKGDLAGFWSVTVN